jgi:MoxR-like ATPase
MPEAKENAIQKKVDSLIKDLSKDLLEREEIVAITVLSAIAGQSAFLYGPPGTAKSLIARRMAGAFKESNYFEYLMQRFSTPEDVFGPVSISELKKDNYVRKTENYLPEADIAFLDEIWKSSPAILNTLLTIINERIFKNGNEVQKVPLKALIAASNEFPQDRAGLDALYDRFIMRLKVMPIKDRKNFEKVISKGNVKEPIESLHSFSNDEWSQIIDDSENVTVSKEVFDIINRIKKEIESANVSKNSETADIYISDRRWQKSVQIIKVAAWLNGRSTVIPVDALLLRHCLWSSEENLELIQNIVEESVSSTSTVSDGGLIKLENDLNELEKDIQQVFFESEDIYQTERINGADYFKFSFPDRRGQQYAIYVPVGQIRSNADFHPCDRSGNQENRVICNFNSTETVSISIDSYINTYGGSNNYKRSGQYVQVAKLKPTFLIRAGTQKETTSKIRTTYANAVKDVQKDMSVALKEMETYLKEQKEVIYTPFVPVEKQELVLIAINKCVEDLKNHQITAERLLKKVESCYTSYRKGEKTTQQNKEEDTVVVNGVTIKRGFQYH